MSKEVWGWYGVDLPFRPARGTYGRFSYSELPKIIIKDEYKDITDIEKLADFLHMSEHKGVLFDSPTACFFEINRSSYPLIFYCDQQGCIFWCLDSQDRVVTDDDTVVAKTLPEFLSRVAMENSIWIKTYTRTVLSEEEEEYVGHYRDRLLKPTDKLLLELKRRKDKLN